MMSPEATPAVALTSSFTTSVWESKQLMFESIRICTQAQNVATRPVKMIGTG